MSKRRIRVIHPTDEVRVVFGAGDEYRYLATGHVTDGEYFLVEAIVPPGGGPPSHIQTREEEAFYILAGETYVLRRRRTGHSWSWYLSKHPQRRQTQIS